MLAYMESIQYMHISSNAIYHDKPGPVCTCQDVIVPRTGSATAQEGFGFPVYMRKQGARKPRMYRSMCNCGVTRPAMNHIRAVNDCTHRPSPEHHCGVRRPQSKPSATMTATLRPQGAKAQLIVDNEKYKGR